MKKVGNIDKSIAQTPMMKQFVKLKSKHPDALMLFRCGDFYETFSNDAVLAANILGITLTRRLTEKSICRNGWFSSPCLRYLPA